MPIVSKALTVLLGFPFLLFFLYHEAAATNLQAFTAQVDRGRLFYGYAEPAKQAPAMGQPVDPSRIYLFPIFYFDNTPIVWRNNNGDRVFNKDESSIMKGTVRILLNTAAPTHRQKLYIVGAICNCNMMPPPDAVKPPLPNPGDPNAALQYGNILRRYDWDLRCSQLLIMKYAFSSLYPSSVQLVVSVGSKRFMSSIFQNTTLAGQSYLSINVETGDKATMAALLENDFIVNVKYTIPISHFASGYAFFDWNQFMSIYGEKLYSSIKRVRTTGSSFLFFRNTRRTISESVKEYTTQSTSAQANVHGHIQVRDDIDGRIEDRLTKLIYPEIRRDDLIRSHTLEAQRAEQAGKHDRAKLHYDYIKAVQEGNQGQMVDVVASLAALAKGNVLGFLAKGFAFSSGSGRGSYTYRRLVNVTDSTSITRDFSQIMLQSLSEEMSVSIRPLPVIPQQTHQGSTMGSQRNFGAGGGYPFRPTNVSPPRQ